MHGRTQIEALTDKARRLNVNVDAGLRRAQTRLARHQMGPYRVECNLVRAALTAVEAQMEQENPLLMERQ